MPAVKKTCENLWLKYFLLFICNSWLLTSTEMFTWENNKKYEMLKALEILKKETI